jgi:predicted metal-dependent hydrolase
VKDSQYSILYGKRVIPYHVQLVDRKTMEIAVHPDGKVLVKAPKGTDQKTIRGRVLRRARWISKQIDYFSQFEPRIPSRRYVGGETHLFLGRQYRLKIKKQLKDEVKLKGSFFYVMTSDTHNVRKIKKLIEEWHKEHAQEIFLRRLNILYKSLEKLRIAYPKIQIRKMTRRWGSCGKHGIISLNEKLIKTPLVCIDYVIMHELCHLKEHSHNNGYFKLLTKYMPDWRKRKERLEKTHI